MRRLCIVRDKVEGQRVEGVVLKSECGPVAGFVEICFKPKSVKIA